jgi:CBS domain-containing protein
MDLGAADQANYISNRQVLTGDYAFIESREGVKVMPSLIKEFMTKQVMTIDVHATVFDAAEVMTQDPQADGYVVVLEEGKPAGIVTERDIVQKVVSKQLDPVTTSIASIMSTPLITIDPDVDLLHAPELMNKHNISKLVVVKDDILYGVITAKVVGSQCNTYVNQAIRDVIRWTNIGF